MITIRPARSVVAPDDLAFARDALPAVSRTFAPAIAVLPRSLAHPVRLAYLLCRVADTIEDTPGLASQERGVALLRFRSLLAGGSTGEAERFSSEIGSAIPSDNAEGDLLRSLPRLLAMLATLPPGAREAIAHWTGELALGMALFTGFDHGRGWSALATVEDLEAYEYYVAGTVGRMLDDLIRRHLGRRADPDSATRATLAVHFGLGLQATNILQDLAVDRARGWSYLPEEVARRHGTSTEGLHRPDEAAGAMAAVHEIAGHAVANLDDGLEYLLSFQRRRIRIRLFCLLPLLLAVRTLTLVCSDPTVLTRRVRITRAEVRELIGEARTRSVSNTALRALYRRERRRLDPWIGVGTGR